MQNSYFILLAIIYVACGLFIFLIHLRTDFIERNYPRSEYNRTGALLGHGVICLFLGPLLLHGTLMEWLWRVYVKWIVRQYILIKFKEGLINEETKQQLIQKLNA